MKLSFTKMQAIGNDFIIINQIETSYNLSAKVIQKLADRHFGIGFDQLLIIENSQSTANDFKYRILMLMDLRSNIVATVPAVSINI